MSDRREPATQLSPLFTWRSSIATSTLPPTVRHVALTLSLHMNELGGSCFPSRETLAVQTGLSVSTVIRAIRTLEEEGYLRVERPAVDRGRGHPNRYTATLPEGCTCDTLPAKKGVTVTPEDVSTSTNLSGRDNGDTESAFARSRARKRDPVWEVLFELETGLAYSPERGKSILTRKARASLNAAAAEIRETGISPEELRAAIAAWPRVMGPATCTAQAVAKHLPRLRAAARGVVFRHEDSAEAIAARVEARLAAGGDDV